MGIDWCQVLFIAVVFGWMVALTAELEAALYYLVVPLLAVLSVGGLVALLVVRLMR